MGLHLSYQLLIHHFVALVILPYIVKNFCPEILSQGDSWRLILNVFCNYIFILSSFSAGINMFSENVSFRGGLLSICFRRYPRCHYYGNTFMFISWLGVYKLDCGQINILRSILFLHCELIPNPNPCKSKIEGNSSQRRIFPPGL